MGVGSISASVSTFVSASEVAYIFEYAFVFEIVSESESNFVYVYYLFFRLSYTLSFLAHPLLLIFAVGQQT